MVVVHSCKFFTCVQMSENARFHHVHDEELTAIMDAADSNSTIVSNN